jgi:hypothetical protein
VIRFDALAFKQHQPQQGGCDGMPGLRRPGQPIHGRRRIGSEFRALGKQSGRDQIGEFRILLGRALPPSVEPEMPTAPQNEAAEAKLRLDMSLHGRAAIPGGGVDRTCEDALAPLVKLADVEIGVLRFGAAGEEPVAHGLGITSLGIGVEARAQ